MYHIYSSNEQPWTTILLNKNISSTSNGIKGKYSNIDLYFQNCNTINAIL